MMNAFLFQIAEDCLHYQQHPKLALIQGKHVS